MSIIQLLVKASGIVWATPIIILLLGYGDAQQNIMNTLSVFPE